MKTVNGNYSVPYEDWKGVQFFCSKMIAKCL